MRAARGQHHQVSDRASAGAQAEVFVSAKTLCSCSQLHVRTYRYASACTDAYDSYCSCGTPEPRGCTRVIRLTLAACLSSQPAMPSRMWVYATAEYNPAADRYRRYYY